MKKKGELHPLKTPEGSWKEISINIIRPLPKSNGKDTIVVIVDWFTKIICLKATTMNVSSEEITKIYWDEIWKLHQEPFSVTEDLNSHPDLWRISWRHWRPKECYWQHIILKQTDKWSKSIRKSAHSYDIMWTINKITGQNG